MTPKTRSSLAIIAAAYALWFATRGKQADQPLPPMDKVTAREMAGTWTDPDGPAGNCISFVWTMEKPQPGDPLSYIAQTGTATGKIKGLFGIGEKSFTFGFNDYRPDVKVFITFQDNPGQGIVRLKAIDHTHMQAKVLDQKESGQTQPLLFKPTGTILLKRTEEASFVPNY